MPTLKVGLRCLRCGGNVMPDYDNEWTCLQCGQEHDKHGNMLLPRFVQPTYNARTPIFRERVTL